MRLEDINLKALREVPYDSAAKRRAQARGGELSRKVYEDKDLVYKIWPKSAKPWRTIYVGGVATLLTSPVGPDGKLALPGFTAGLYDSITVPAFVDYIYSGKHLVGYATQKGIPLTAEEADSAECLALVDRIIERTIKHRHVLRDLYYANIIRLPNGKLSLIDLETQIAHLDTLDLNAELETGALRRITAKRYRQFLIDFFDVRVTTPSILRARANRQATSHLISGKSPAPAAKEAPISMKPEPSKSNNVVAWIESVRARLGQL
jgi:hypothetical protein